MGLTDQKLSGSLQRLITKIIRYEYAEWLLLLEPASACGMAISATIRTCLLLWRIFTLAYPGKIVMNCRPHCGACCIAPSITSLIPGMPDGKPAGVACVQLMADMRCAIFGKPERPACCGGLQASPDMCGADRQQALAWLDQLEYLTKPSLKTDALI